MSTTLNAKMTVKVPEKIRMGFFPFSPADGIFTGIFSFAVIAVMAIMQLQFWAYGIAGIVLLGFLYRLQNARFYWWLMYQVPVSFYIWLRRDYLYLASVDKRSRLSRLIPKKLRNLFRWTPIKFQVDSLRSAKQEIGLLHHVGTQRDTFVVTGDGCPISSLDGLAQVNHLGRFAQIVKKTAMNPQFDVGLSLVFRRRPPDSHAIRESFHTSGDPNVFFPPARQKKADELTDDDKRHLWLNQLERESQGIGEQLSGDVTMAVVVTVERTGSLNAQKHKGTLASDAVSKQPALKLNRDLVRDLTVVGKVGRVTTLDKPALERYVRETWDVEETGLTEFRELYHTGQLDAQKSEDGEPKLLHFPQDSIRAVRNRLYTDEDSVHTIIKVTTQPEEIRPGFWDAIMNLRYTIDNEPVWLSVAYCGERVSVKNELRILRRFIPGIRTMQDQVFNKHYRNDPGLVKRSLEQDARRGELYTSGSYQQSFTILICISDTTDEKVNEALGLCLAVMDDKGVTGTIVKSRERQLPALWSAAGAPMM